MSDQSNAFETPMMQQYLRIKKEYSDCLLLFRLGDFYEMFLEDAHIGADVLDITLTARDRGKDGRIPMAGIPYHAIDSYLHKLVKAGHKVAICEQVTEPDGSGLVERDVVRIVTPGTLLDEKSLNNKENNYVAAIEVVKDEVGFAVCDLSTGDFQTNQVKITDLRQNISDLFSGFRISECILPEKHYNDPAILKILAEYDDLSIFSFYFWDRFAAEASAFLQKHFVLKSLEVFGIAQMVAAQKASAALIGYLKHTQKDQIHHIKHINKVQANATVILDKSTLNNLEIFATLRDKSKQGSLIHAIDRTKTSMGGRLLKRWVTNPLNSIKQIEHRLGIVEYLLLNRDFRTNLSSVVDNVTDIERTVSRLSVGVGSPRDTEMLKIALKNSLEVRQILWGCDYEPLAKIAEGIATKIDKIIEFLNQHIIDDPPFDVKQGGFIKAGVHAELDKLRNSIKNSKEWLLELESIERERTGIASLKVKHNKVYGFYIEVSKANLHLIPEDYIRKQTMVNAERFFTKELKEREEEVVTAEDRIKELEYEIFLSVVQFVISEIDPIKSTAEAVAEVDVYCSFAEISEAHQYCRPVFSNKSSDLVIKEGRHPVVEQLLGDYTFVPNDTTFENGSTMHIITGPNMGGKSVYIRQVALIVLMAHVGMFVPAKIAKIPLVDRIFVRSGASDVITSGLSTFMVEMTEVAHILNNATSKSLIVMDEVGRGTSTYDGISIAWAIAEYIVKNIGAKTLFATHYHELQRLENYEDIASDEDSKGIPNGNLSNGNANSHKGKIMNYHLAVKESRGDPVFLHRVLPGGADHSYGIAVARLAGVPEAVTENADTILEDLEHSKTDKVLKINKNMINGESQTFDVHRTVIEELRNLRLDDLTPIGALNYLDDLLKRV